MSRRRDAFEAVFETFKTEGRELTLGELRNKYPKQAAELRKVYNGSLNRAVQRLRKIYADRWNEIYDVKLGIQYSQQDSDLSPLDKLRRATEEETNE